MINFLKKCSQYICKYFFTKSRLCKLSKLDNAVIQMIHLAMEVRKVVQDKTSCSDFERLFKQQQLHLFFYQK